MVARLVRDQEAMGSNPVTSTTLDSTEPIKGEFEPRFFIVVFCNNTQRAVSEFCIIYSHYFPYFAIRQFVVAQLSFQSTARKFCNLI